MQLGNKIRQNEIKGLEIMEQIQVGNIKNVIGLEEFIKIEKLTEDKLKCYEKANNIYVNFLRYCE